MKVIDAINELNKIEKRKFEQTYDLIVNLRNIDLKNPDNKISKEIVLPHGRGKPVSVFVISEQNGFNKAKLDEMAGDKKAAKKFAKQYDFLLGTADLMPHIGKTLGRYLAPIGRMPQPLPPNATPVIIEGIKKRKEATVRMRIKNMPTFQMQVGSESMKIEEIVENAEFAIREVIAVLPKGRSQVKNVSLKLTMSKPLKVEY